MNHSDEVESLIALLEGGPRNRSRAYRKLRRIGLTPTYAREYVKRSRGPSVLQDGDDVLAEIIRCTNEIQRQHFEYGDHVLKDGTIRRQRLNREEIRELQLALTLLWDLRRLEKCNKKNGGVPA